MMDLKEILKNEHSKQNTLFIVNYITGNSKLIKEIIDIACYESEVLAQRASWVLGLLLPSDRPLILPFVGQMVQKLNEPKIHNATKRNFIKLFEKIDIPEEQCCAILDTCLKFLESKSEAIAVKAYSMTVLLNISKKHLEFKREIKLALQMHVLSESAGVKSRAKKVVNQL
jgi:hypothetical protein